MYIHFLSANDGTKLTKTIRALPSGQYEIDSYPHVALFNSHKREVDSLEAFHANLVAHAAEGLCLLKGNPSKTLTAESRAGSTDAHEATSWLCLDVDAELQGFPTPSSFVDSLGPEFVGASFVFQHSASSKIKYEHWRGHIFILLSAAVSPQATKQWLIERNFGVGLSASLSLSASGGSLRYPLDVTTCQNDKLLFIAPPVCEGFEDPLKDRFVLIERSTEYVKFQPTAQAAMNNTHIAAKITELRADAGLPSKKFLTAQYGDFEILKNPDAITVTGKREARGFIYLNFNGGDSWAYYYPSDKPSLVFNFKGEPALRLKDIDPSLAKKPSSAVSNTEFKLLVLRDPKRDTYYNGKYWPATQNVEIFPASNKTKLEDFMGQYGMDVPEHIPDWELSFDPTVFTPIDFTKQWINLFEPSGYMRRAEPSGAPEGFTTIDKILTHVCVDDTTKQHFINWLAHIFQTRHRTNTAWIFQGVHGTGKGLLYEKILKPLLGADYCNEVTIDSFDDQFNLHLEKNIILFIDEANVSDARKRDRTINKLKNLVTETELSIRAMRTNRFSVHNFNNLIFTANQMDMVSIDPTDRRFNVAPRQETPLVITEEEVARIVDELQAFANSLQAYAVDTHQVRTVMFNRAREMLIDISETSVDKFFRKFSQGDLEYFTQFLSSAPPPDETGLLYSSYAHIVRDWIGSVGVPTNVSREDLHTVYKYIQGAAHQTASKFSRMCARYCLNMAPIQFDTQLQRGIRAHIWQLEPELIQAFTTTQNATKNVSSIR